MVGVGKPGLMAAAFEMCALFELRGGESAVCWWCVMSVHVGCSVSRLPEDVKEDTREGGELLSVVLPASASVTCCGALWSFIPGSGSPRHLATCLPLTSSLRTRDRGHFLPSKSQGGRGLLAVGRTQALHDDLGDT